MRFFTTILISALSVVCAAAQSGTILMRLDCLSSSGMAGEMFPNVLAEDIICFNDKQFYIYSRDCEKVETVDIEKGLFYSFIPSQKKGIVIAIDTLSPHSGDIASAFRDAALEDMKVAIDSVSNGKVKYKDFTCEKSTVKVAMKGKGIKANIVLEIWDSPDIQINAKLKEAIELCQGNSLFSSLSMGRAAFPPMVAKVETDFNFSAFLIVKGALISDYSIVSYTQAITYTDAFKIPADFEFIDRDKYLEVQKNHFETLLKERKGKAKKEFRIKP